jgi:hypothetical protein
MALRAEVVATSAIAGTRLNQPDVYLYIVYDSVNCLHSLSLPSSGQKAYFAECAGQRSDENMKTMRKTAVALQFALLAVCLSGCRSQASAAVPDVVANDALASMKKLQSQVAVGVTYRDYMVSLGEADYRVKELTTGDSPHAESPYAKSLTDALKSYQIAGDLWGERNGRDINCGSPTSFCTHYPELVTHPIETWLSPYIDVSSQRQVAWEHADSDIEDASRQQRLEHLKKAR